MARVIALSIPAILAKLSSMAMQYIDAAMAGSLGANASASIGLVSTSTWLLSGLCISAANGFSVQTAHFIGAGEEAAARGREEGEQSAEEGLLERQALREAAGKRMEEAVKTVIRELI